MGGHKTRLDGDRPLDVVKHRIQRVPGRYPRENLGPSIVPGRAVGGAVIYMERRVDNYGGADGGLRVLLPLLLRARDQQRKDSHQGSRWLHGSSPVRREVPPD
jgi:hypothetical protein